MNMKFKTFALILALFCFSTSLFAQPATYSFSGFGGGLPASAKKVTVSKTSDTVTSQRIILDEDDDEDEDYNYNHDYSDEPKVNKAKSGALIATYVVVGVVVVAGIVFGAVYLSNESAVCCEQSMDSAMQGCGEGCAEGCSESCSKSMSEACSASMAEACSSSTSSAECSSSISGLFAGNGLSLLPIYVP